MTAAANKRNPANILLHSSPESGPATKKPPQPPSPASSDSSSECTKPFSLPLPARSPPYGTPPMMPSTPEVPPAPYRATITSPKLPASYLYGRKLEWTPGGHPVEPPVTSLPPGSDRRAKFDEVGNQQRPKAPRRTGLLIFDCPDACLDRSPVHIPPFQDAFQSRRTSSNYSFSSEESLRRKNVSPRKSAPKEP